ncbi:MAG: hypothetical protein IPG59_11605 [Candidatus Melainabacteria bacterium]|nr:MAG: hypothetical protein IPG59_11605 [Candidatus Melainabacteria bacterium]
MSKSLSVILNDTDGTMRSVYANAPGIVQIEQPTDADFRRIKSVSVSTTDAFDPNAHYVVQVNLRRGKRTAVVLFGITPEWLDAFSDFVPDPAIFGATLVADISTDLGPAPMIII